MSKMKIPAFYIPQSIIPKLTNILVTEGLKVEENITFSSDMFTCETIHKYILTCLSLEGGVVRIEFGWNKYAPKDMVAIAFMGHLDKKHRGDKQARIKLCKDIEVILRRHGLTDMSTSENGTRK